MLGLLDLNSYVIYNGKTSSDTSGAPTFINRSGSSVVDYIVTESKLWISKFKPLRHPITSPLVSIPPFTTQAASITPAPTNKRTIVKWVPEKAGTLKLKCPK